MTIRTEHIQNEIKRGLENADPQWVGSYLVLAHILLKQQLYVCGDDIKAFCMARGLWEPDTHNRWGSMLTLLAGSQHWLEPLVYVAPHRLHNHMERVTFYRSMKFDEKSLHVGCVT